MQRAARTMYYGAATGGGAAKPKKVSPVVDDDDAYDEENPPMDDGDETHGYKPASSPFRVNQEHEPDERAGAAAPEMGGAALQIKSSVRAMSPTTTPHRLFTRSGSNQDLDAYYARPSSSAASEKYAVIGQKQQWRKSRSDRPRQRQSTITHVSGELEERNEREEFGERASSYLSSHESSSHASQADGVNVPTLPSARSSTPIHSSRSDDSEDLSRLSSARSEGEIFVVTRQKKSKYAAKLYLPGQNPLYLGRYRSEDAARAACESAFATITTPRK